MTPTQCVSELVELMHFVYIIQKESILEKYLWQKMNRKDVPSQKLIM